MMIFTARLLWVYTTTGANRAGTKLRKTVVHYHYC
jgi:hypothetical protein